MESEGKRDGMIKEAEGEAQVTDVHTLHLFVQTEKRARAANTLASERVLDSSCVTVAAGASVAG